MNPVPSPPLTRRRARQREHEINYDTDDVLNAANPAIDPTVVIFMRV